jgi:hypothetical protein
MEALLTILTYHGKLRQEFDMKRMLNLLKVDRWEESVPMHWYLQPLKEKIISTREELLEMRKRGLILCKYRLEDNEEMETRIIDMVAQDVTCQWLMGHQLKRDQFCFIYDVIEILYESPCRERLLAKDKELLETTVPTLVAFRTLLHMRKWLLEKEAHDTKMKKLAEPVGPAPPEPEPEEEKTEEEFEAERAKKLEEEMEMFGRYWIWEEYYSEDKKGLYQAMAELFKHVNKHVIQDMQDSILMKVFRLRKEEDFKKMHEQVQAMKDTKNRDTLLRTMGTMKKKADKELFEEEQTGIFQDEDKQRTFCVQMRPPFIWNFWGEEEHELEHLINPEADPEACYKEERENNRVTKLLQASTDLGVNLRQNDAPRWAKLVDLTIDIFIDHFAKYQKEKAMLGE